LWNADTAAFDKSCVVTGGQGDNTVGRPCGPDGTNPDGTSCDQALRLTRTWEHTLGASHELGAGVRIGADVVYRRPTVRSAVGETNRVRNLSGADVLGYRNGRAESVLDYSTENVTDDRYLAVTGSVRKQTGAFKMMASYTWSQHRGGVIEDARPSGFGPGTNLEGDIRLHSFRAFASADFGGYASGGLVFSHDVGWYGTPLLTGPSQYGATVGPGIGDANDPTNPLPTGVTSDLTRLNLQLRARTRRLLHVDGDAYLDAINLLHSRGVAPFYARAGLELRY
jgi:hypothetical protein